MNTNEISKPENYIYEYLVYDERYHRSGMDLNPMFATNDLDEAKLVANEVGFNCVIVRYDSNTGEHRMIYDAWFNTELPLRP